MSRLPLEPIGRPLDQFLETAERERNRGWVVGLERVLDERRRQVEAGWGERARERVRAGGLLTTRERLDLLRDPGSPLLPVGTFVNWGRGFEGTSREAPGAGVVTAFTRVEGRWVLVVANDNLTAAGAWWPSTPEKIQRAQGMALQLGVPVVYLVECSGLFLPEQARSFAGRTGAGGIFRMNALLSDRGVPQIAGVFGACIAGGGYMPIISDRVVMTEQAYMVIAGAALIKGAKSQRMTSLDIGGPEVHVHRSGCADLRVPDDAACILALRQEVARLPSSAASYYRHGQAPLPPRFSPEELREVFPPSPRESYEVRQVLARILDGSLFHEVLPGTGREVVVGVGRIGGLWVGIAANDLAPFPHPRQPGVMRAGGILYREGVARLALFSRLCEDNGLPLIWLQDVAGFDIGEEAESQGLLGFGSSLIYANSTRQSPMITVLLRRASGAGYYAQAGLPYEPVVQLSTPLARQAVMEGKTLAIATWSGALDDDFEIATRDPAERARVERGMAEVAERIEREMDPYASAARMDTDEVIGLGELRTWLEGFVEMSYQATGRRRIRNPRIWTLHDLEACCSEPWSSTT